MKTGGYNSNPNYHVILKFFVDFFDVTYTFGAYLKYANDRVRIKKKEVSFDRVNFC